MVEFGPYCFDDHYTEMVSPAFGGKSLRIQFPRHFNSQIGKEIEVATVLHIQWRKVESDSRVVSNPERFFHENEIELILQAKDNPSQGKLQLCVMFSGSDNYGNLTFHEATTQVFLLKEELVWKSDKK